MKKPTVTSWIILASLILLLTILIVRTTLYNFNANIELVILMIVIVGNLFLLEYNKR